jgi:hypothetical protein
MTSSNHFVADMQGDQIGRIFFHWAIVFLASLLKMTEVAQNFKLLFPQYQLCINFDKKWLATLWGDFFTNSSGHPADMCARFT